MLCLKNEFKNLSHRFTRMKHGQAILQSELRCFGCAKTASSVKIRVHLWLLSSFSVGWLCKIIHI